MSKQIKSKKRVKEHGEVFTPEREVKAMVDLVLKNKKFKTKEAIIESTWFEPSCGNGNFLSEILKRKLEAIKDFELKDYDINILKAVSSLYAVELLPDNRNEAIYRLTQQCIDFVMSNEELITEEDMNILSKYYDLFGVVRTILDRNIVLGNTFEEKTLTGDELTFDKYSFDIKDNGIDIRTQPFTLEDIRKNEIK